jgi:hypothetical protein
MASRRRELRLACHATLHRRDARIRLNVVQPNGLDDRGTVTDGATTSNHHRPKESIALSDVIPGPRIGIAGTFDVANFGDLLFPRIFEREMAARLELAETVPYSPYGWEHPVPLDGGRYARPLGAWTDRRCSEIASDLDLLAIGGGELIHHRDDVYAAYYDDDEATLVRRRPSGFFIDGLGQHNEDRCSVVWHSVGVPFDFDDETAIRVAEALKTKAYVSVRDDLSAERLYATGFDGDIHVVPDSGILMPRLFPDELLERRMRWLKSMGWYPAAGRPLVVQGSAWILDHAADVADAITSYLDRWGQRPVVTVEIGPTHGDGAFAAEFKDRLDPSIRVFSVPGTVTQEDIVAAIAGAEVFAGLSLHGSITALSYGIPSVVLDLANYTKLDGFARLAGFRHLRATDAAQLPEMLAVALAADHKELVRSVAADFTRRVDRHFDVFAELALASWERSRASDPSALRAMGRTIAEERAYSSALERANETLRRRIMEERLMWADRVDLADEAHPGAYSDERPKDG